MGLACSPFSDPSVLTTTPWGAVASHLLLLLTGIKLDRQDLGRRNTGHALVWFGTVSLRPWVAISSTFNGLPFAMGLTAPLDRVPPTWRVKSISLRRVGRETHRCELALSRSTLR